jgi:hypothetical protein
MNAWKYAVAFLSGFFVFLLLCTVGTVIACIVSDANGYGSYMLGKGIFTIFAFQRDGQAFTFTLQKGIVFIALLGGLINCVLIKILHLSKKNIQVKKAYNES